MTRGRKRIAVVGAGVSGLGAAWALRATADVAVYERASRIGGHACTVDTEVAGQPVAVDVGFICYNEPNYPNLRGLFAHLGVETIATDMSFAVSDPVGYEWGSDALGLFAWKRNLVNPSFHALLREILRFNRQARQELEAGELPDVSLGAWLDLHGFSARFRSAYLMPMSAAIWSTPEDMMPDYPVSSFLNFFDNHRLMHALRPTWRTVKGGSRTYVSRIVADLGDRIRTSANIVGIHPVRGGGVLIREQNGRSETFDAVILSAHADESRKLLDDSYEDHRLALGSVRFSSNRAYLHTDASLMPRRRSAWASWNVIKGARDCVCVTYWMNRLQKLQTPKPLLVTLNPVKAPREEDVLAEFIFEHPMYDAASAAARRSLQRLQGHEGIYVSGAWLGDGFHEAGLRTGLEAAAALGGTTPWAASLQQTYTGPVFTDLGGEVASRVAH
jgi:predicted NAD/FAD-binding protein